MLTHRIIRNQRLLQQQIAAHKFETPGELVKWLGAVQAQDYAGALWAMGLRIKNCTEKDIEQAIANRTAIRTWSIRGTLHFVSPQDVRWMLQLLTPRIISNSKRRYKQLALDDETFSKSRKIFIKALEGGKQLTRKALYEALEQKKISTAGMRGLHIIAHLAQQGVICFGTRNDKQPTLVLLDEWVASSPMLAEEEALAALASRYFNSHGPATLQDFIWWSGLTAGKAKLALELVRSEFLEEAVQGQSYWFSKNMQQTQTTLNKAVLLPNYDEYVVGYKDRSMLLSEFSKQTVLNNVSVFDPNIVIDGKIVGNWKRTLTRNHIALKLMPFATLTKKETKLIAAAAQDYGRFMNLPVTTEQSVK